MKEGQSYLKGTDFDFSYGDVGVSVACRQIAGYTCTTMARDSRSVYKSDDGNIAPAEKYSLAAQVGGGLHTASVTINF